MTDTESLRARWNHLYRKHLPSLAKARDPVQPSWPVHLDHCFARIVLDNAVGVEKPWTEVIKAPAVKNMTAEQLVVAIEMGERIATGEEDLVALDERSLMLRGKRGKAENVAKGVKRKVEHSGGAEDGVEGEVEAKKTKRTKSEGETISSYFLPAPTSPTGAKPEEKTSEDTTAAPNKDTRKSPSATQTDIKLQLRRIATSTALTPFRKKCLTLLCHIPRGRYSTYQALADHISATSHKTCARAVGSAMKNNPFAPEVPCHRVIAADGRLGGFKGDWGVEGRYAGEKLRLLGEEGVAFDSSGKVKGRVYRGFGEGVLNGLE